MTHLPECSGVLFPLNSEQIQKFLPHRPPMLMLDRALAIDDEGVIQCEKDLSPDAFYFQGHFPDHPIMPGVMICEAVGQAGALLAALEARFDTATHLLAFGGFEKAKFRKIVKPNETLCVYCKIVKQRKHLYKFEGRAESGGALVATLGFSAALTPK